MHGPGRTCQSLGRGDTGGKFTDPMSSRQHHEIRGDRKSAFYGLLVGWLMKLLVMTLRLEVRDECGIGAAQEPLPPVIYILWHNRFFTVPAAWNRLCGARRQSVTLTSASRDGDMVARAMAVFGLGAIRGSSSRRGVAALVGLKRALRDGFDICLTPDGPRGPRYQLQSGVIKLAETSGAAVVPVHVQFSAAWRIKTWDRFVIPMPLSRVRVTFGAAIHVPRGMEPAAFESTRREIEALLVAGTDNA